MTRRLEVSDEAEEEAGVGPASPLAAQRARHPGHAGQHRHRPAYGERPPAPVHQPAPGTGRAPAGARPLPSPLTHRSLTVWRLTPLLAKAARARVPKR